MGPNGAQLVPIGPDGPQWVPIGPDESICIPVGGPKEEEEPHRAWTHLIHCVRPPDRHRCLCRASSALI